LNSNDVFGLDAPGENVSVWPGKGANAFEVKTGQTMIETLLGKDHSRTIQTVSEGAEPDAFWAALGGKGEYSNAPELSVGNLEARLFQCTDRTGVFKVDEIEDFTQDDLDPDDVMLLDAQTSVFVWIGAGSTENERQKASGLAVEYIKAADDGRTDGGRDVPVYVVDAGAEPIQFTLHFHGWDDAKARENDDVYSRKLRELDLTSAVVGGHEVESYAPETKPVDVSGINPNNLYFSFDKLKIKPLPPGVDGTSLDAFLAPAEFPTYFKITREEYYKLPKWKQLRTRKEVGLF